MRKHHVFLDEETVVLLAEYGRIMTHPSIVGQIRTVVREALTARRIDCDEVIRKAKPEGAA